jgi:hypothetical protein
MATTRRTFADRVLEFHRELLHPRIGIAGVKTLDPYRDPLIRDHAAKFYRKYYADNSPRIFALGINPGRFGAGATGIPFTDPIRLQEKCGIENDMPKKQELSSAFIYAFIDHWGGPESFYEAFFFTAVSPIGFTKNGLNYNYYDDRKLLKRLEPFLVESLRKQLDIGARREVAIILGTGKNRRVFEALNRQHGFFKETLCVDHPRFIMQYRRPRLSEYLDRYQQIFARARASVYG